MHRDAGVIDEFELLCSIPALKVQRLRMRRTRRVSDLEAPGNESVLITLTGSVVVETPGREPATLAEKDVYYLSRGVKFSLQSPERADFLWAQAPAEREYPSYVKRISEVKPVASGSGTYRRSIYTSIGEKDPANRFIVGFVEGEEGNWTSFPPHRHDGKPEVYVYYGMGKRFGVQVVAGEEDRAYVVREGDAVLFERGYHPNVATPGVGMKFVWIISADPRDRNLSVELHPEYRDMPMGQTHLTTK
ncbi:MAG TPA: 5-deoxy-glucuronate isomerase [Nitrososphaerales archaeon]|nr:5-deoxy-glucuronate isomerase [Nitrososphaerales archaeon]